MINVDNIDRTVHRFQPDPLNSVKAATIQLFLWIGKKGWRRERDSNPKTTVFLNS